MDGLGRIFFEFSLVSFYIFIIFAVLHFNAGLSI
jgi:hypothetical protein